MLRFSGNSAGELVRKGDLEVQTSDGQRHRFGDGSGRRSASELADRAAERQATINPALSLRRNLYGRPTDHHQRAAFTRSWSWARGTSPNFRICRGSGRWSTPASRSEASTSATTAAARRSNIARHYDLDARLYELFLDADRQYSCAYFEHPGQSLDDAQAAKKRHIAAKLLLKDGATRARHRLRLRRHGALSRRACAEAKVAGVTLSEEQFAVATERARQARSGDRVEFRLQDYRDVDETLRPHRFGRHVRACRRRPLRRIFRNRRSPAQGRRRDAAPLDRPQLRARRDQPLDPQIHFPGRLHSEPLRSAAGDRTAGLS